MRQNILSNISKDIRLELGEKVRERIPECSLIKGKKFANENTHLQETPSCNLL